MKIRAFRRIVAYFFRFFNFSLYTDVNREKMVIPIMGGTGFDLLRSREIELNEILRYIFKIKAGCFVDVGANLGQTLLKVRSISLDIPYYGFEPNSRCCCYLQRLIRVNGFKSCTVFPVGAFSALSLLRLFSDGRTGQGASIIQGFRSIDSYAAEEDVLVIKVDDIMNVINPGNVSVVKIDVEGGELDVLKGMEKTLLEYQPFVVCEILPVYDSTTEIGKMRSQRQAEVRDLLTRHGYRIFQITDGRGLQELFSFGVHSDLRQANYLFVPNGHNVPQIVGLDLGLT